MQAKNINLPFGIALQSIHVYTSHKIVILRDGYWVYRSILINIFMLEPYFELMIPLDMCSGQNQKSNESTGNGYFTGSGGCHMNI